MNRDTVQFAILLIIVIAVAAMRVADQFQTITCDCGRRI